MFSVSFDLPLATGDGAVAIDADARITWCNPEAEKTLGYKREEVLGKRCYELFQGLDERGDRLCSPHCPVLTASRRGQVPSAFVMQAYHGNGKSSWLHVSNLLLNSPESGGQLVHLFYDLARRQVGLGPLQGTTPGGGDGDAPEEDIGYSPPALSPRELEILWLVSRGLAIKDIALSLGLSEATVRHHMQNAREKLAVRSQLQAVLRAMRMGLIRELHP